MHDVGRINIDREFNEIEKCTSRYLHFLCGIATQKMRHKTLCATPYQEGLDLNGAQRLVGRNDFSRRRGKWIESFKKSWRTACRLALVQDFHMHDLRHTFCSNLILSGAGLKDVKDMIGHLTLEMADRNAHLDNKGQKELQGWLEVYYERARI